MDGFPEQGRKGDAGASSSGPAGRRPALAFGGRVACVARRMWFYETQLLVAILILLFVSLMVLRALRPEMFSGWFPTLPFAPSHLPFPSRH